MIALVTGAAGFIGSHLCERLVAEGFDVLGLDSLTTFYSPESKRSNISRMMENPRFTFIHGEIQTGALHALKDEPDYIFHLAGQPGVQGSWGDDFSDYVTNNIHATRYLLRYAVSLRQLKRFVAASSSSVYGRIEGSVSERVVPKPVSPYGVTKLSSEHLCTLYGTEFGVPTVSLRYFTVYGPRQRPDMAISRVIQCGLTGGTFRIYGSGEQVRDFTYVGDVVEANFLAATKDIPAGSVMNIGGGSPVALNSVIAMVSEELGSSVKTQHLEPQMGDPARTSADATLARDLIGWRPATEIRDGLKKQILSMATA